MFTGYRKAVIEILPNQPGDVDRTCADIRKAQALLGYQPSIPFEVGIQRTTQWYREAFVTGLVHPPHVHTLPAAVIAANAALGLLAEPLAKDVSGNALVLAGEPHVSRLSFSPSLSSLTGDKEKEREKSEGGGMVAGYESASDREGETRVRVYSLSRDQSDLELSSYVEKASKQVQRRTKRIFLSQEDEDGYDTTGTVTDHEKDKHDDKEDML
jgi:glucose/arabinose dehydrogenase